MTGNWRSFAVLLLFVVTSGACSGSAPTSPATTSTPPAPAVSAPATGLANADAPIFTVTGAETTTSGRGACVFEPSTGQFTCPPRTNEGITVTTRFTLYDANGRVQSAFDRATTSSIKTETTASGTTSRDGATVTIARSGVMTTTGLGPNATTHTLNGTEQGTVTTTATRDGVTVTTEMKVSGATTNLVVPVARPGERAGYPLSGARVHTTTSTVTRGSQTHTVTTRRQETFNGTSIVQVEMTVNGVTRQCTIDLESRTSTCDQR